MKWGREDNEMEDTNTKSSYSKHKLEQKHGTFYTVILLISIYPHVIISYLYLIHTEEYYSYIARHENISLSPKPQGGCWESQSAGTF